ncbi:MAG: flagellar biosynthesis protein FlhF [Betaproteobacteria bacterium HGW-Betaproteobacteria-14]|nr:MAG: flagellar biosynthesis protein FlhF [Betaproteobacteria bacterium HGW-Betaproteobacteria-14]
MNIKRYFAPTAREALRRVKEELGGDAIVLSNRSVDGGVEITAVLASEIPAEPTPAFAAAPRVERDEDFTVSLSGGARKPAASARAADTEKHVRAWQPAAARPEPARVRPEARKTEFQGRPTRDGGLSEAAGTESQPLEDAAAAVQSDGRLMRELAGIKGLIEQQLAGFAWSGLGHEAPAKTLLLTDLLDAGFSAQLARRLVSSLPAGASREEGHKWLKDVLNRNLHTVGADDEIVDAGGVYALVGPTGVGKTTTTAKLAARCVVRHGADSVALLTTDGYRIGAHEQLRIYGRILGVQVHAVRDAADLRRTLADLSGKHMVLVDTIGMSQRDRMVAEQAAMLDGASGVRRLLLMNATSRGDTLDDVVRAYGLDAGGSELAGAILTKVDEAVSLAPAIDALIRNRLQLYYVANGQRVPEDLHLPNRAYLLHRALRSLPENSPHRLIGDEAGLLLAAGSARSERPRGAFHG